MSQSLPFFKNYPIDWLMSEKVACMELHEIGAYKLLTDHQWLGTRCTLPDDLSRLKVLAKWEEGKHGDFSRVLACFPRLRSPKGRRGNPRLLKEYAEAMARQDLAVASGQKGARKRWATKSGIRKKRTGPVPPGDWLTTIKTNPLYAHVNFEREDAKMADWLADHPGRIKNKQFVRNWLNKIEPPLSNGSTSLTCPHHPTLTFADAHAKKAHDFDYHTKLES